MQNLSSGKVLPIAAAIAVGVPIAWYLYKKVSLSLFSFHQTIQLVFCHFLITCFRTCSYHEITMIYMLSSSHRQQAILLQLKKGLYYNRYNVQPL